MKKALALTFILALILPVLLLPAVAAEEETRFLFERVEPISTFSNNQFEMDERDNFYCEDLDLKEGYYYLEIFGIGSFFLKSEPFYLSSPDSDLFKADNIFFSPDSICSSPHTLDILYSRGLISHNFSSNFCSSLYSKITYFYLIPIEEVDSGEDLDGTISSDLTFFLTSIKTGLSDFTGTTLSAIVLGGLGVCAAPVLVWFGYRFIKGKAVKAFKKGKV